MTSRRILGALLLATLLTEFLPAGAQAQHDNLVAGLQRLADAGNAEATYHIGMAYQTCTGVAEDHAKALEAFRKAAALGDPLASYKVGCYYDGQGGDLVARDADLALRYKLVAAEAGYALAQQDVASLYLRRGDTLQALKWLENAASQGWAGSLLPYASLHNGAADMPQDRAVTAAYFRLYLRRVEPSEAQNAWLAKFESEMSPEERTRATLIVDEYRPAPTPLTMKGLSGRRAAEALLAKGH